MDKKAVVISSDRSGSGKSSFSIFLSRFFSNQQLKVIPFKCGPDYIDTLHLKYASKNYAYNLDTVLMNREKLKYNFTKKLLENNVAIVEGVMGFYDGVDFKSFYGSTYDISKTLCLPVIFILDVSSSSYTVAARLKGLISLVDDINVVGVILNKVGSTKHESMVRNAVEYHTGVEVIGAVPKLKEIEIASRHLGIKTAIEMEKDFYEKLMEEYIKYANVDKIVDKISYIPEQINIHDFTYNKQKKVAYVAYDEAFNFYYHDNLDYLENNGFKIKFFSPLENEVPDNPDFIYIGGGYPELFAKKLAKCIEVKEAIRLFAKRGVPILAECGGMMYLSKGIFTADGFYEMCNLFDFTVEMTKKRQSLGYVKVKAMIDTYYFEQGEEFVGHEFHYSRIKESKEDFVFEVYKLTGEERSFDGFYRGNALACYTHFHFLSENSIVKNLIRG
ncbi:cobyrinate a,c-diamide synthase [Deferribacter abyssi]|uniref:cobyrinate a,c-diamide synthase n=1 Tax=Deferribacter abyssi TaxID=213806 RepID=UPI003C216AD1